MEQNLPIINRSLLINNDTIHYSVQKVVDWIQNYYRLYNR